MEMLAMNKTTNLRNFPEIPFRMICSCCIRRYKFSLCNESKIALEMKSMLSLGGSKNFCRFEYFEENVK